MNKEICPVHDETCGRISRMESKLTIILVIVVLNIIFSGAKTLMIFSSKLALAGG